MLSANTVFTSLIALHAFLASTGQGQVNAHALRRGNNGGHTGRQSHVIRGLLDIAGRDETFNRRQSGCDVGFFACSDGTGCCPNGQTCDTLSDGTPTCCCTTGGNCPAGQLPCSANVNVCCPTGDVCSASGGCSPAGSGGSGGSGGGSSGGSGGGSSGGSGGGASASKSTSLAATGGLGGSTGGLGGSTGGFGATTNLPQGPTSIVTGFPSESTSAGFSPVGLGTTPVVTVTSTPGSGNGLKSGEVGLRAGAATVVMGSFIGLALIF